MTEINTIDQAIKDLLDKTNSTKDVDQLEKQIATNITEAVSKSDFYEFDVDEMKKIFQINKIASAQAVKEFVQTFFSIKGQEKTLDLLNVLQSITLEEKCIGAEYILQEINNFPLMKFIFNLIKQKKDRILELEGELKEGREEMQKILNKIKEYQSSVEETDITFDISGTLENERKKNDKLMKENETLTRKLHVINNVIKKTVPIRREIKKNEINEIYEAFENKELRKVERMFRRDPSLIYAQDVDGDNKKTTLLHYAVRIGWKDGIDLVHEFGIGDEEILNQRDENGYTPLILANKLKKTDLINYLLSIGARPDKETKDILNSACIEGDFEKVASILNAGVDIEFLDESKRTPLICAIESKQYEIVKYLVNKGANIEAKNKNKRTSLMIAIEYKNYEIVDFLINKKANIETVDDKGDTPLLLAIKKDLSSIYELLVLNGADVNRRVVEDGPTPIITAIELGKASVVDYLYRHGADINILYNNRRTPLSAAKEKKNLVIISFLELKDAKDNKMSQRMIQAIKNSNIEEIDLCFQEGEGLEVRDDEGNSPLLLAYKESSTETIEEILKHNVNINAHDDGRNTVLSRAAEYGDLSTVQLLVERDAEIDTRDAFDRTPLMKAVSQGHEDVIKYLVAKGANVNAKDKNGKGIKERAESVGRNILNIVNKYVP